MGYIIEQFLLRNEKRLIKFLSENTNSNLKIIERCGGTDGNLKIYGFLREIDGVPELKWYGINGLGELYEYEGVIIQCP